MEKNKIFPFLSVPMRSYRSICRACTNVKLHNRLDIKEKINVFEIIVLTFGVILGGVPTLYLIVETVATLSQKVYRKVKFGVSMFD